MDRPADGAELAVAVSAARREPEVSAAVHAALEASPDPVAALRQAVETLVGYVDGAEVDIRSDRGIVRICAGVDPVWAARREQVPLPLDLADHPVLAVLRDGAPRLLDLSDPDDAPLFGPPEVPTSVRALGMTSIVLGPIVVRGEVIGTIGLARGPSGRTFDKQDLDVVVDLGRRIGLAWHNNVLLAERASILSSLHDGLVVTDADGVVLEVNRRWVEMTGFDEAASVGCAPPYPWWASPEEHPEALAEAGAAITEALEAGRTERRVIFRRIDGSFFPVLVSFGPIVDRRSQELRGLVAIVKDLSGWEGTRADLVALQRTTAALAAARTRADVAGAVLDEAMARLGADIGVLYALSPEGQHLEIVEHRGLDAAQAAAWGHVPVDRPTPSSHAVRDGTVVSMPDPGVLAREFPDLVGPWVEAGLGAVVAAPISWDGRAQGALALCWRRPRPLTPGEQPLLEAIANQCGQALRRAEGYDIEHRTSQVLQGRLLSDVPVVHERATVVARYRAASADVAVGGDWYDVVILGPDRLTVVVGDVVGSGIDAAAVMGQLRSALRGIVAVQPDLVAALESLDRLATGIDGATGATACCVALDLAAGTARVVRAGHPPPLLVPEVGAARFVEGHADPPLGFARRPRRSAEVALAPGDALLLYTDGLVERRETSLTERLDLLAAAAGGASRGVLDELVDGVLAACADDRPQRDDIAVLAVRDEPAGPGRFRAVIHPRPRELAPTRRALREWLEGLGVEREKVDDVLLAVSEVLTNAIEHAYSSATAAIGLVSAAAHVEGDELVIEVRDAGRWKDRPSTTVRGRGLQIARAVVDAVDVRTGPSGTTAILRTRI